MWITEKLTNLGNLTVLSVIVKMTGWSIKWVKVTASWGRSAAGGILDTSFVNMITMIAVVCESAVLILQTNWAWDLDLVVAAVLSESKRTGTVDTEIEIGGGGDFVVLTRSNTLNLILTVVGTRNQFSINFISELLVNLRIC